MTDENQKTLEAYENGLDVYNAANTPQVTGSVKEWLDAGLAMIPKHGKVLELGSGPGRDADYMEAKGFNVDRTDAAGSFVKYLRQQGKAARLLNALSDDFGAGYDMVYANAVLLHFTSPQCQKVIQKAYKSLKPSGILAFSVKIGDGSGWSTAKLNAPRHFTYWQEADLRRTISSTDFDIVYWEEGATGHDNSDWYHVILQKN